MSYTPAFVKSNFAGTQPWKTNAFIVYVCFGLKIAELSSSCDRGRDSKAQKLKIFTLWPFMIRFTNPCLRWLFYFLLLFNPFSYPVSWRPYFLLKKTEVTRKDFTNFLHYSYRQHLLHILSSARLLLYMNYPRSRLKPISLLILY